MKKVILFLAMLAMFIGTSAMAGQGGIPDRVETLEQQVGELQSQPAPTNGVDGATGATGQTGATGATGSDGSDGRTGRTGRTGSTGDDGIAGTNGSNGVDGSDGTNAQNDELYNLLNKGQASTNAMNSVELNPDHVGWSASVGYSNYARVDAGAVGVMYGQKLDEGSWAKTVGYNVKAYTAEGGYNGISTGLTIGW